jgi:tRNA(fMet)-specific endonuclease VapC
MAFLLDTNHCSKIIRKDHRILSHLQSLDQDTVTTSVIVRGELKYMVANSQEKLRNELILQGFLGSIYVYEINSDVSDIYGVLKAKILERWGPKDQGKRQKNSFRDLGFSDNDLWIAATAITHQLVLVSADRDFLRMQQVIDFQI